MAHNFKRFPELTNSQMQFYYFDSPHKQITEGFLAEVVKVTDGDSIRVKTDFRDFDFPIRLANINAPEMNEGGEESKNWLEKELLGEEIYVKIDKNNRVGKFGRIIGEILLFGVNINYQSLAEGLSLPFGQEDFQ